MIDSFKNPIMSDADNKEVSSEETKEEGEKKEETAESKEAAQTEEKEKVIINT